MPEAGATRSVGDPATIRHLTTTIEGSASSTARLAIRDVDHLTGIVDRFLDEQHVNRYSVFLQDYGGPIGFRLALAHPERIQALVIQNAVAHEQGLSDLWIPRRAFWADRSKHEATVRANFLSLEATRQRHVGAQPRDQA